jgi:predicted metalloprotease
MNAEELKKAIEFTTGERQAISRFDLTPDAFLPLILAIRFGGDWSYSGEELKTLAVKDKTTYFDEKEGTGYTLEELFLLVNPIIDEERGRVERLEKCGMRERRLVERPYHMRLKAERVIKATVDPSEKGILLEELEEKEVAFEGTTAYGAAHEMEHLQKKEEKGRGLWEFKFRIK